MYIAHIERCEWMKRRRGMSICTLMISDENFASFILTMRLFNLNIQYISSCTYSEFEEIALSFLLDLI